MIVVYSSTTCAPCKSLYRFLDHKNVAYQKRDIIEPEHAKEVLSITGQLIVPVTVINETPVVGLNYGKIAELLNA